jgi:hypothetical protein
MLPVAFVFAALVRAINYLSAARIGIALVGEGLSTSLFRAYSDVIEAAVFVVVAALVAPVGRTVVAAIVASAQTGLWVAVLLIELAMNSTVSVRTPGILWVLIGSVIGAVFVGREDGRKHGLRRLHR